MRTGSAPQGGALGLSESSMPYVFGTCGSILSDDAAMRRGVLTPFRTTSYTEDTSLWRDS